MKPVKLVLAAAVALLLATAPALAQEDPSAPDLITPVGISVSLGGGVAGFVDEDMRDFADVGGAWGVRAVIGTREMVAFEVGYTGFAGSIDALGLDEDALLLGTSLEGAARLNFLDDEWQPYVIAGIGWRRYDLTRVDVNTSSVAEDDNVLEVPLGAGISYRYAGLVVDARAIVRATFDEDMVATPNATDDTASMDNWEGSVNFGWEF